MKRTKEMINLQDIPGETDFDDGSFQQKDHIDRKDNTQVLLTGAPTRAVSQTAMNEISDEAVRVTNAWTKYERRIF